MGLEPTRHRHTHLKRACLPIPALPQIAFDCKKDSSTFGGTKSSPILYLFSCPIKQPLQPFLSFITVILAHKPFVGADSISARGILRSRQMPRDIAASRRGEQCSPEGFCAAAHCHGRTMFAPTAHIRLCVGGAKRRRPGNYAHLTGGYRIRPYGPHMVVCRGRQVPTPNAAGYCRKS